ncbi:hypothetical protein CYMTET_21783, partial [Cymbomonas tetramitiformis]
MKGPLPQLPNRGKLLAALRAFSPKVPAGNRSELAEVVKSSEKEGRTRLRREASGYLFSVRRAAAEHGPAAALDAVRKPPLSSPSGLVGAAAAAAMQTLISPSSAQPQQPLPARLRNAHSFLEGVLEERMDSGAALLPAGKAYRATSALLRGYLRTGDTSKVLAAADQFVLKPWAGTAETRGETAGPRVSPSPGILMDVTRASGQVGDGEQLRAVWSSLVRSGASTTPGAYAALVEATQNCPDLPTSMVCLELASTVGKGTVASHRTAAGRVAAAVVRPLLDRAENADEISLALSFAIKNYERETRVLRRAHEGAHGGFTTPALIPTGSLNSGQAAAALRAALRVGDPALAFSVVAATPASTAGSHIYQTLLIGAVPLGPTERQQALMLMQRAGRAPSGSTATWLLKNMPHFERLSSHEMHSMWEKWGSRGVGGARALLLALPHATDITQAHPDPSYHPLLFAARRIVAENPSISTSPALLRAALHACGSLPDSASHRGSVQLMQDICNIFADVAVEQDPRARARSGREGDQMLAAALN